MGGVRGVGRNGGWYGFIAIIGTPHGGPLLTGFVKLQREEAR